MTWTPENISGLIRARRSVFPKSYNGKEIPKTIIQAILEDANWAPTHKMTEPWRFKVFRGKALNSLSQYLAEWYKENTSPENFSQAKYDKTLNKPLQSSCVIAICMQRDPQERLPEWEEIAAVSCAVQNMSLSCTAYGIGSYWSSPKSMEDAGDFLQLGERERCLGFLYMGYSNEAQRLGKRDPVGKKVRWIE